MRYSRRTILWVVCPIFALLLLLAGSTVLTSHLVAEAERKSPPIGRFQAVEHGRIHFVRQGTGRPVVFIHGLGGLLQDFSKTVFDSLSRSGDLVALDRPGYGYSEHLSNVPLTIELQTAMIHAALDSLGIRRPLLVGHSFGGAVAINYALTFPEDCSGLVLLAPVAHPVTKASEFFGSAVTSPVVGALTFLSIATPITRFLAPETVRRTFGPSEVPPDYLAPRVGMTTRPSQLRAATEDLAHLNASLSRMSPEYGSIRIPVTIIVGDSDRVLVPGQQSIRLASEIPSARVIVLEGCGHQVQYAFPDTVASVIRDYLTDDQ